MDFSRDSFTKRHIGPSSKEQAHMLKSLGFKQVRELMDQVVPENIRMGKDLALPQGVSEFEALSQIQTHAESNRVFRSLIGMGYSDTLTPPAILRNVLENPAWYTPYTPYQAEISQGRLEALLNFQTMVMDLTGMDVANASLLDEATAVAEAMSMAAGICAGRSKFFVSPLCHPQVIEVVRTRAEPLGIEVVLSTDPSDEAFGVVLPYPDTRGTVQDYGDLTKAWHEKKAVVIADVDLLSLMVLAPPSEWGADIVVGTTQRFGVPLGYGGPHAAFLATQDKHKRRVPGRIVGLSKDAEGRPAGRLALQTREQHIRRDKATSNICTAQVLLAVIASMYAVYHGPEGLSRIAQQIQSLAGGLRKRLEDLGLKTVEGPIFDTVTVLTDRAEEFVAAARDQGINLRGERTGEVGIALDEVSDPEEVDELVELFSEVLGQPMPQGLGFVEGLRAAGGKDLGRKVLTHPVFHRYQTEMKLQRYLKELESKDLSLMNSMIPLGSCTMKLNAAAEMIPVTWPEFGGMHPFAPLDQAEGYRAMMGELEGWLSEVTGFAAVSLQPNAGSQGEYAGLLAIRAYHRSRGQERKTCLIPMSAHGTNPASAVMVGMKVQGVKCDSEGNVDVADLRDKAAAAGSDLAALMVTYPSTHGVFEEAIREICDIVHEQGGQVYMDGANMNAQIGYCRPGDFGPDVCHLNLHKTFCIPHGGGGPGMGPIGVAKHLVPFVPSHAMLRNWKGSTEGVGAVAAAPWGSPSILPISWMYIAMMGRDGLRAATEVAILNANYLARRLEEHYPVLYKNQKGFVAHECILDLRPLKAETGVEVEDVAKRLMDYGFHAPTISFPVPGTLMIEPTESESVEELDRFVEAMAGIRREIQAIADGKADKANNVLKRSPHTSTALVGEWDRPYSREEAVFPLPWVRENKYWPPVSRVDNVYGDRNLFCACAPME